LVVKKQQQLQMQFFIVFFAAIVPVNLCFVQKQTHVEKIIRSDSVFMLYGFVVSKCIE
jgi:ABC-type phosphate/phosphonate transport system permease subunit